MSDIWYLVMAFFHLGFYLTLGKTLCVSGGVGELGSLWSCERNIERCSSNLCNSNDKKWFGELFWVAKSTSFSRHWDLWGVEEMAPWMKIWLLVWLKQSHCTTLTDSDYLWLHQQFPQLPLILLHECIWNDLVIRDNLIISVLPWEKPEKSTGNWVVVISVIINTFCWCQICYLCQTALKVIDS